MGLSEKEARVYLASLELGPSPVQIISQKAKVNRATTYVVIDSLMEIGLMSTYESGKKTFFTAESPERLMDWLKNQELQAQKKIQILANRIPELKSISNDIGNKPKVKYFEGIEGLRAVQQDFVDSLKEGEEIYVFLPLDDYLATNLKENIKDISEKRVSKNIKTKLIYTSKKGRQLEYERQERVKNKEYKYVDYDAYPIRGGMNVWENKIFMIDYLGKMGGIVIENKVLAFMMKKIFNLTWNCLKRFEELPK